MTDTRKAYDAAYCEVAKACPVCGGPMWIKCDFKGDRGYQWHECANCGAQDNRIESVITTTITWDKSGNEGDVEG